LLPHRKAPARPRARRRARLLAAAALLTGVAACSRERPAPPPPPQLSTVQRFVEQAGPKDPRLTRGGHVFLAGDARIVMTSARPYRPGLLCESGREPPMPCRAKRPAGMPPAPHALFTRGGRAAVKHAADPAPAPAGPGDTAPQPAGTTVPPAPDDGPQSVLLPPGVATPVGRLSGIQTVVAQSYAMPALEERSMVTQPFVVPPGALLRLSIGVEEPAWWVDSAPVFFRVVLEDEGGARQDLYRRILDPAREPDDRRWYDNDVDLTDLAGRKIRLHFVAEPAQAGDSRPSLPLWGDPRLIAPQGGAARPSIVLVSLDTLRARSTSLYGYALDTTPNLKTLAARGTTFEHAFTTYSNTLPSHMSMLTGLLPGSHGVRNPPDTLGRDRLLLAQILRRAGFATAAFTEDALLDSRRGFSRGFSAYYENTAIGAGAGDAAHTFGRAVEWAGRHADEPFFLFVHTYQVHFPYDPPPAYQGLFAAGEGAAPGGSQRAYEQEVRYADDLLQRLVDGLRAVVPDEQLLLVVTAGHGEEFFEHGMGTHNQLFDEVMHIPLVMVWPGHVAAGRRVADPVSLIDVPPTVLQLAGVPAPPRLDGLSLVPLLAPQQGTLARAVVLAEYPKTSAVPEQHFVARSRDAKCIVTPSGAADVCFDLPADPGERDPRPPAGNDAFSRLHDAARAYAGRKTSAGPATPQPAAGEHAADADEPAPPAPNADIERKMRALGYVE
jgi:arylsulfatase A-like enzyme